MSAARDTPTAPLTVWPEDTVYFEETGEERRVTGLCRRCQKMWLGNRPEAYGPISASGIAHMGEDGGMTACGIDATGDRWWWPL